MKEPSVQANYTANFPEDDSLASGRLFSFVNFVPLVVKAFAFLPPIPIYKAFDSILQVNHIKVHQQPDGFPAELEVRDYLSLVDWRNEIHGVDFNHHQVFDQQIHPIPEFELRPFVDNRKPNLACSTKAGRVKFVLQTGLVGAL